MQKWICKSAVINKEINDRKLMVIGVDSSHIKGKRTGVAMVATINDSFTDFYNKEEIIKEENKEQLQFCISSFIEQAIVAYNKKNKIAPKGIVIYRQGVSLQQKEFLKTEIQQIDTVCKTKNILYYYILVNTKTTFKFFEKSNKGYSNPGSGLLVIDGVTNRNYFEFYIQPQEVTQGSATPTCFHVAYGNLDFPEMIPKFTYDLCHIYSNWQGTVRIPNVIKAAAKNANVSADTTWTIHVTNVLNTSANSVNGHAVAYENTQIKTSASTQNFYNSKGALAAGPLSWAGGKNKTANGIGYNYQFQNVYVLTDAEGTVVTTDDVSSLVTVTKLQYKTDGTLTVTLSDNSTQILNSNEVYISPVYTSTAI